MQNIYKLRFSRKGIQKSTDTTSKTEHCNYSA